jgi:hypothetical protein
VLLALGLFLPGGWRYLGLLDIPAFAYAAYFALRNVEDWQVAGVAIHKHQSRKAMEQKILSDFAAEAGPVDAAMKLLNVDKPESVLDALSEGATFAKALQEAQQRLAAAMNEPEYANVASRREALRREEQDLEAQLLQKGQNLRDIQEIERDLYQVRQSMGAGSPTPEPSPASANTETTSEVNSVREDPFPFLLERAADLFNAKPASIAQSMRERAGQYLTALTDRQLQGIDFDREGKATVMGANGKLAVTQLSPRELDLAYLGVRLTLAERIVAGGTTPFVIDSGLDLIDPGKHALLCKMVKYIASQGQVVQLTQLESLASLADATLSV